jgi:hypothetical protein
VLCQIGREEKAAAADKVSPIVCHGVSIARLKVMGFAEPVIGPDPLAQPILRSLIKVGPMSASLQNDRIAAPQRNDAMGQQRPSKPSLLLVSLSFFKALAGAEANE